MHFEQLEDDVESVLYSECHLPFVASGGGFGVEWGCRGKYDCRVDFLIGVDFSV